MIVVKMNADIRGKDVKLIGPFTSRQCICIGIAIAYAAPIAALIPVDVAYRVIIGTILAIPAIICGWIKKDGQPFEVLAVRWAYRMMLTPSERKVKQTMYAKERAEHKKALKKEFIASMSAKDRKKYLKLHKNGAVTYSSSDRMFR